MWTSCEPKIRAYFLEGEPGEMNIVWDELSEQLINIVKGYKVRINMLLCHGASFSLDIT